MFGDDQLKGRIEYNNRLCQKLLEEDILHLRAVYPIGSTDSTGQMVVQTTKSHRDKQLPLPTTNGEENLFLLKCRLPADTVREDKELCDLVGGIPKALTSHYSIDIYFLTQWYTEEFLEHVSCNLSLGKIKFKGLGEYGICVLARVRGGPYCNVFCEKEDLKNVAGLDVLCLSSEDYREYTATKGQQTVSSERDDISSESGDVEQVRIDVMTQLMNLSVEHVESNIQQGPGT
ncbi:DUF3023 domain-containing protein [Ehrlichia japonica]|uniref:Uncharacterized protein n=1 Tax=Ehrlichia japonica TaxID=391036 RepID=X5H2D7_9RICK|nr:DUF3023 domain-containing protein [Ehrlichia japonica]AHX04255.1 hypothetical protein EHF_0619 [Ehrlichia japonica]